MGKVEKLINIHKRVTGTLKLEQLKRVAVFLCVCMCPCACVAIPKTTKLVENNITTEKRT